MVGVSVSSWPSVEPQACCRHRRLLPVKPAIRRDPPMALRDDYAMAGFRSWPGVPASFALIIQPLQFVAGPWQPLLAYRSQLRWAQRLHSRLRLLDGWLRLAVYHRLPPQHRCLGRAVSADGAADASG